MTNYWKKSAGSPRCWPALASARGPGSHLHADGAETVFAMLACAAGAIHRWCSAGLPAELAKRIDDATPKVLLTASCGIEGAHHRLQAHGDEALTLAAHQVERVVVLQRSLPPPFAPRSDWRSCAPIPPLHPCRRASRWRPDDPLYIYTSGTTGVPKAWCAKTAATRWR